MIAGDVIRPSERKALVATLQAATGAPRSACGTAIASLIDDGCATQDLIDLHQRAAALLGDDRADRCPRCLEARPLSFGDRCRECEAERVRARDAGRVRRAPPDETPTPDAAAAPQEPAAVLDRFDLEDVIAMCARKRAYTSQIDADRTARACEARRGTRLRSYSCPACQRWHITKRQAPPEAT